MKRWISFPERYPHRCPWSHQAAPEDGPYLDAGLTYFAAREIDGRIEPDRRESLLCISPQAIIEAGNLPGSPIVVMARDQWQALIDDAMDDRGERDRLEEELADTAAALAECERRLFEMTDPEAIAGALEKRLDERYARKTGPKPKVAA